MHLCVDDSGEQVQARDVDGLAGHAIADRADPGNAAVSHANVRWPLARLVEDGSALEDKIEGLGQGF